LNTEAQPRIITLSARRGRIALQLVATAMGRDLCVALSGGERAHIGAVALSQARPSLEGDGGVSSSTSVITLTGHKEDDLAKAVASRLAVGLDAAVCVACGIHVDGISAQELKDVAALAEELVLNLIRQLRS